MGDDSSLRESLHGALSSRNANSPLELCLKAPPQAELEQLLGFSLDPATYKRILRQDGGEKQKHPESRVEQDAAPKEAEGAATEGTLDLMNQLAALDPPELAMPVQPVPETLNEPEAALADEKPARTPEKPPAPIGPPLSPGSPVEPCMHACKVNMTTICVCVCACICFPRCALLTI